MTASKVAGRALGLLATLTLVPLLARSDAPPGTTPQHFTRYAVAADHPIASQAGAEMLAEGGTAADAAAAVMLTLGVVNPSSSGLGGGGFALYYRASDRSLTFLDFRERAPLAAKPSMFADAALVRDAADRSSSADARRTDHGPLSDPSQLGGLASGVPGEAAGIEALLTRFGTLSWSRVVAPSLRAAERGFPISGHFAAMTIPFGAQLRRDPALRRWFPEGAPALTAGETLRRPELLPVLRALVRRGARGFYEGPIARAIVRDNRRAGGILTLRDLREYRVVERPPLEGRRFGFRFVTAPPPSAGGYSMLESLAFLEAWTPYYRGREEAIRLHALAESWKGPYLDRQRYFGDPDFVDVPLSALTDPERRRRRAAIFHPTLALPPEDYALPLAEPREEATSPEGGGTSHFCVVDAEGNVASVTTTVNLPFGARYTAAGILMNDEMDDFARALGEENAFGLPGGTPNLPAPGKRPVSSMSPTIVFDDDHPVLCIGASGGSRIPTAVQQVALDILLRGMDPQRAVAAPRIHHQGIPNVVRTELPLPLDPRTREQLVARGHRIETADQNAVVEAIAIRPEGEGRLRTGSDPRKGGRAAGD